MSLPSFADVASTAFRWLEYVGLVGFVGVVVVRRLAGMRPPITWARVSMQPALAAALAGGVAVVTVEAVRADHLSVAGVARVAAEGIALGLCLTPLSPTLSPAGRGGRWVAVPAIVAILLLPFGGHAALVNPSGGAIFTDAIHILSAGAWAGSILVLAALRPPGGWGGEEGRAFLRRFGPVAFLAFAITALTGVVRAAEALGSVTYLWTTPYGLVLSAKTAGVLVAAAMSALLWRRGFRFARAEGIVVLMVLAATALLAAFPIPPYYPIVELVSH